MTVSPAELPLQIVEEEGRVIVRFPANTSLSGVNAEAFSRELAGASSRMKKPHIVVDLSGVNLLTSMILAKLIALNGRVRASGGRLTLSNPTPVVHQVFKVTRLDTILEVTHRAP